MKKDEVETLVSKDQDLKEKIDLLNSIIGGHLADTCSVGSFSESTFHQIPPPPKP